MSRASVSVLPVRRDNRSVLAGHRISSEHRGPWIEDNARQRVGRGHQVPLDDPAGQTPQLVILTGITICRVVRRLPNAG